MPKEKRPPQVFISYSRRDLSFVEQLAADLKAAGFDVWYDLSGLGGGARWRIEIEKAIRESQYVIVVLSPDSVTSEWVESEYLFASNLKRKIVPLLYKQCDLPLNYLTLHYIDIHKENYERNFNDLLRALDIYPVALQPQVISPKPDRKWKTQLIYALIGIIAISVCVGIVILASQLPPSMFNSRDKTPTRDDNAISTVVALTMDSQMTQGSSSATLTPEPVTDEPLGEITPVKCDEAHFITDVTVPDGTIFSPNENFTKTWRIKNTGSCPWTSAYAIVFDKGDPMGGPTAQAISGTVMPGQVVDISITLMSPNVPGKYKGYWKLRNSSGEVFGVPLEYGTGGAFFVEIEVLAAP
jgi:hypothetical protein